MVMLIVSGGQTGVDRGAFDAARRLGYEFSGWAPQGFRAEDGVIPFEYARYMRESSSSDYPLRTRLNVQDSDATLLISYSSELTGGTKFTANVAKQQRKPCKHLVLPDGEMSSITAELRAEFAEWIRGVSVLNVAGPRESSEPGIQGVAADALIRILSSDFHALMDSVDADGGLEQERVDGLTEDFRRLIDEENPANEKAWDCLRADIRRSTNQEKFIIACQAAKDWVKQHGSPLNSQTRAEFRGLIEAFYELPGNSVGGELHVVLDDCNVEREFVESGWHRAVANSDPAAAVLAELLLSLSDDDIARVVSGDCPVHPEWPAALCDMCGLEQKRVDGLLGELQQFMAFMADEEE